MLWGWIVPFMPARWGAAHLYRAWTSACMRAFWTDIKHGPGASLWPLCIQEAINSQGISWTMAAWLAWTAQGGKREVQREKRRNERDGKVGEEVCTVQLCPKAITASHWAPGVVHSHATTGTVTANQSRKTDSHLHTALCQHTSLFL